MPSGSASGAYGEPACERSRTHLRAVGGMYSHSMAEAAMVRPHPRRARPLAFRHAPIRLHAAGSQPPQTHQTHTLQAAQQEPPPTPPPRGWKKPKWLTKKHHIAALVCTACAVPLSAGWAVLDSRCDDDLASITPDSAPAGREYTEEEQDCRLRGAPPLFSPHSHVTAPPRRRVRASAMP